MKFYNLDLDVTVALVANCQDGLRANEPLLCVDGKRLCIELPLPGSST